MTPESPADETESNTGGTSDPIDGSETTSNTISPKIKQAGEYEPTRSRSSKASRRCASAPVCTSGPRVRAGLHHLVYEIVDNSVDEALAGYADTISVTMLADGGVRVVDNGRGIPVDPHSSDPNKSTVEVVLTILHAGGKVRRRRLRRLRVVCTVSAPRS